jgi:glucose-6-phosphate 1-dehydrogenase
MKTNHQLEPTIITIFGGAGDLTWRKLMPALFDLYRDESMPEHFSIIIVDRVEQSDEGMRKRQHDGISKFSRSGKKNDDGWSEFERNVFYQQGDFKKLETYTALSNRYEKFDQDLNLKAQRIFYMATPPVMFGEIPKYLGEAGLANERKRSRIVVEKPIGYDLESARTLNGILTSSFNESQIFRIDHYLGKETVQNILAFRFSNPLFEPVWNRRYIDYITITVAEELGVGHRGGYYDKAGALRDMVQNHLMQLLCLVAMEPMVSFDDNEIRNKKADVLHAIRHIPTDAIHQHFVRGQYGKGKIQGKDVFSYREECDVVENSQTETFVALKLFVDNWRWHDVPFYLRTGKRLAEQSSEIAIQFRSVPHRAFPMEATKNWQNSSLILSIQPYEGILLRFQAKQPGPKFNLQPVEMKFNYRESFTAPMHDAYETLLWDVIKNDATLFMRADQVEAAWQILTPVLESWKSQPAVDFPNYAAGSWGPEATQRLFVHKGHHWHQSAENNIDI